MPSRSQTVRARPQDRVHLPARMVRVGVALADRFLTTYQAVELDFAWRPCATEALGSPTREARVRRHSVVAPDAPPETSSTASPEP